MTPDRHENTVSVCVSAGVHLAALLLHCAGGDRHFHALPYKVKAGEAGGREAGQEEPVTMLSAAGQLGRPETPVRPHCVCMRVCACVHVCVSHTQAFVSLFESLCFI